MKIKQQKSTPENIFSLTMKSANAKNKELYIFEIDSLEKFLPKDKYEKELNLARKEFLNNKIKIFQITNNFNEYKFKHIAKKENTKRIKNYRYIDKDSFTIKNEIIIFDNIVAVYDDKEITIIEDKSFAKNQKQAFEHIWGNSFLPGKGFTKEKNIAVYNSCDVFPEVDGKKVQTIVWPDADSGLVWEDSIQSLEIGIQDIFNEDKNFFKDASYLIVITWVLEECINGKKVYQRMMDVWKFISNYVDDRSGPIGDVRIYKNGVYDKNLEVVSGSTLLILAYEEKMRRQSINLESYLNFSDSQPNRSRPPFGICNGKDFFK